MKYLVTGSAGFIGFHVTNKLLERGDIVVGLDIINDYYDVNLKYARLAYAGIEKEEILANKRAVSVTNPNYTFVQLDLADKEGVFKLFSDEKFDVVINLAAQAGVRYSIINPAAYVESNIVGFTNILEGCRHHQIKHLVYASSSSVYGANETMPFSTSDNVDHPLSLYAASKKANELMAHTYSNLFDLPTTGLRFFTVYGPWGRPDMALFLFIDAITKGNPIDVFNHGKMKRDFTYVDDIVEGIIRVADRPARKNESWTGADPDPGSSYAPYKIYNIGNSNPVELMDYIGALEKALGKVAIKNMLPLQAGDVPATFADVSDLMRDTGYKPETSVEIGVAKFVQWYKEFYDVNI
ncbi:NAD-dependent epimerase [Mongoliitalea lutea]|uniref:NAD-dependent epimerase n=1 Tax=Mongoliitalea lutea TaxID=849756 RepID=A0A8J3D095_9BACT|nr:NAD-dependent epimerase [Mongoliitalea lutea]GHB50109.1 NAD-dependent epimerase [Mongoliitalea lutea]